MRHTFILFAGLMSLVLAAQAVAADTSAAVQRQVIYAEGLANVPGKKLTAVVLYAAPGAKSTAKHHHAGTVLVYVVSGSIQVQFEGHAPQEFSAGQCFVETPGTEHLSTMNLSATEPAKLLAVFVADDGATLTTYDK